MSSKHTPEPWSIKAFDDGTFIITEGDDTDDPSNMVIASKGSMSIVEGREAESIANAHLLRNAAKMYEALKSIIKHQDVVAPGMPSATKLMAVNALSEIDNPKD